MPGDRGGDACAGAVQRRVRKDEGIAMPGKRLLIVLAHPDDETFICGGGVAAFCAAGGEAILACATRGEHGRRLGKPPYATRETLPAIREAELRQACSTLGIANLILLGLRDKCLEYEDPDALAARVAVHIRRLRPDGVLTFHERRGGHTDHCAIGRAATRAWERSGDAAWHPEQLTEGTQAFQPPRLYFLAGGDVAAHPDKHGVVPEQLTTVCCRPVAERKMRAHRAHRTQTQLDSKLWNADEAGVIERFAAGREHFQQANAPFCPGEQGLLGMYV